MTQRTENWSREWNSSTNPGKQRKYRRNAPMHVKDKLVSSNLNNTLRDELGTRSLPVRIGDRAKVMRGDEKGTEGIVSAIDREDEKVYINNLDRQRTDGTVRELPFDPSNLQLQALNLENPERIEKYEVDDFSEIKVEEEELEELEEEDEDEMMQQMQQKAEARQDAEASEETDGSDEDSETESEDESEEEQEQEEEEEEK